MTVAIRCEGLSKRFGDVEALRSLDLEVAVGETLGYLGPNGAGKTVTIRLLVGLLRPSASSVVYSLVAWSSLVEIVGGVVRANHWLLDLSLFHHVAPVPAADPRWAADGLLVVIGLVLAGFGAARFVRRDVATA
jgi:predicted ABC-type transport system involved in lysophospholipase L1 biosynthesis ATPase subunit